MFPTLKKLFTPRNIAIGVVVLGIYFAIKKRKYTTVYVQPPEPTSETANAETPQEAAPADAQVVENDQSQMPQTPAEQTEIPQAPENNNPPQNFLYGPNVPYETRPEPTPTGFYDWATTF